LSDPAFSVSLDHLHFTTRDEAVPMLLALANGSPADGAYRAVMLLYGTATLANAPDLLRLARRRNRPDSVRERALAALDTLLRVALTGSSYLIPPILDALYVALTFPDDSPQQRVAWVCERGGMFWLTPYDLEEQVMEEHVMDEW
jgi:hypothetical protein